MRFLSLSFVFLLVLTTTPAIAFQSGPSGPGGLGSPTPGGPSTTTPSGPGSPTPGGGSGTLVPWLFSSPDDGMEAYGEVVFMGTGPSQSVGAVSVYSYTNTEGGAVLPNELQLQIAVLVDTDPGADWVGPVYGTVGESYATVMPAVGTPNLALLTLLTGGGYSVTGVDLGTLSLLSGGDAVLFRIVEP